MSNSKTFKGRAILKLVIWSVIFVILCGIMISGLDIDSFGNIGGFTVWNWEVYDDPESYSIGNQEFSSPWIRNIDIDWYYGGTVNITVYDGNTVRVEESLNSGADEEDRMRVKLEDGWLRVRYRESGMHFFEVSPQKNLTVYIPVIYASTLGDIFIDVSSSETKISGIAVSRAKIDSSSGDVCLTDCMVGALEIDSASADVTLSGEYDSVEIDTASGDCVIKGQARSVDFDGASGNCTMELTQLPEQLTADCASGSLWLSAPIGEGFKANIDASSGKGHVEYADGSKQSGDALAVGGGKYIYEFDFASGSFYFKEVG